MKKIIKARIAMLLILSICLTGNMTVPAAAQSSAGEGNTLTSPVQESGTAKEAAQTEESPAPVESPEDPALPEMITAPEPESIPEEELQEIPQDISVQEEEEIQEIPQDIPMQEEAAAAASEASEEKNSGGTGILPVPGPGTEDPADEISADLEYKYWDWYAYEKVRIYSRKKASAERLTGTMDYIAILPFISGQQLSGGWYYAKTGTTRYYNEPVRMKGEVNIILQKGARLYFDDGIRLEDGASLNIYEDADAFDEPTLFVVKGTGIQGGNNTTLRIRLLTGEMQSAGKDGYSGIGSCNVEICGGKIVARGGAEGAGIEVQPGNSFQINGGATVHATGGSNGAGIGGRREEDCGNVVISGRNGSVTARGGAYAAGIGGGSYGGSRQGTDICIYEGTVKAVGGAGGAGIGTGYEGHQFGNIVIQSTVGHDPTGVTAEGGESAAGIGGGEHSGAGNITILGKNTTVKAVGAYGGAGIGGGVRRSDGAGGDGGNVLIEDADVTAQGSYTGNTGGVTDAGILPGSAGIGGGVEGSSGSVVIKSGKVTATGAGARGGAGIGGGYAGLARRVEIYGGEITAEGGGGAAGIGGGYEGSGGSVKVQIPTDPGIPFTVKAKGGRSTDGGFAFGKGSNGGKEGTLELGAGVRIGQLNYTDRVQHCRSNAQVTLTRCMTHDTAPVMISGKAGEEYHDLVCNHCAVSKREKHEEGIKSNGICETCGYGKEGSHTVVFSSFEGGPAMDTLRVAHNYPILFPEAPEREGYVFRGWRFGDKVCQSGSEEKITEDAVIYGIWEKLYRITCADSPGGRVEADASALMGTTVYLRVVPDKYMKCDSVSFNGKPASKGGDGIWSFVMPEKDVTVTASFSTDYSQISYAVTFDSRGGSAVSSQEVSHNGKVKEPETPTRRGFDFVEWQIRDSGGNWSLYDFNTSVTGALHLAAKWQIQEFTVSFDVAEGKDYTPNPPQPQKVKYGEKLVLPESPVAYGRTFLRWYEKGTNYYNGFSFSDPIMRDMILEALYSYKYYNAVFVNGYGDTPAAQRLNVEQKVTKPTDPACTVSGYSLSFNGWYRDQKLTVPWNFDDYMPDHDLYLYAKWDFPPQLQQSTVIYRLDDTPPLKDGGELYVLTISKNSTTPKISVNRTDRQLIGWVKTEDGTSYDFDEPVTADRLDLRAVWNVTVSFNKGEGTVIPRTLRWKGTLSEGAIPSVNRTGYDFISWHRVRKVSGNDITEDWGFDFGKPVSENMTVSAEWLPRYFTAHFDSDGGSDVPSQTVRYPDKLEEPACQKRGYILEGWYDGEEKYDFASAPSGDMILKAKWVPVKYTVHFDKNNDAATGSMVDQPFEYNHGMNLSQNAFTASGWTFYRWTTSPNGTGTAYADKQPVSNLSTVSGSIIKLYAQWRKDLSTASSVRVSVNQASMAYNGSVRKSAIEVWDENKVITDECEIIYENDMNAGEARVTVQARPNNRYYSGSRTVTYLIGKCPGDAFRFRRSYFYSWEGEDSMDFSPYLSRDCGTPVYTLSTLSDASVHYAKKIAMSGNRLVYSLQKLTGGQYGRDVITVRATTKNYEDYVFTVEILQTGLAVCEKTGGRYEHIKEKVLAQGKSLTVYARFEEESTIEKDVVWLSSDPSVAFVDQNGKITARSPGKVCITVRSRRQKNGDPLEGMLDVTVAEPISSLKEFPAALSMGTGETMYLYPEPLPAADGDILVWSVNNDKVSLTNDGFMFGYYLLRLSGNAAGKTVLTGRTTDGSGKKFTCRITVGNPVTDFTLETAGNKEILPVGKTLPVKVQWKGQRPQNTSMYWTTEIKDDPEYRDGSGIAEISSKGVLKGVSEGRITVIAESRVRSAGKYAVKDFTVYVPVKSAKFNMTSGTVSLAKDAMPLALSVNITSAVKGMRPTGVSVGSAPSVRYEVDENYRTALRVDPVTGVVTAAPGQTEEIKNIPVRAVVTAFNGYTKTLTCKVSIKKTNPIRKFNLAKSKLSIGVGNVGQLIPSFNPVNPDGGTGIDWVSSDPSVLSVNETGRITALKTGNAVVTATAKGTVIKSGTPVHPKAECRITVTPSITGIRFKNADTLTSKGLAVGKSFKIQTELLFSGAGKAATTGLIWKSDEPGIVSVGEKGVVKALKYDWLVDTVTVTAYSADQKAAGAPPECSVTFRVYSEVKKLRLERTKALVGTTEGSRYLRLKVAEFQPKDSATTVSWNADNDNLCISAVDDLMSLKSITGAASVLFKQENTETETPVGSMLAVKGLTPGVTKLTALAADGSKKKAVCTVTVRGHLTGLALTEQPPKNGYNDVTPKGGAVLSGNVIKRCYTGTVKAKSSMSLKPIPEINGISGTTTDPDLKKLYKNYRKYTDTGVSYLSSDPSVAAVNRSGRISAKAAGNAVITVFSADGTCQAEYQLTVSE